jgi:hypothetical protein
MGYHPITTAQDIRSFCKTHQHIIDALCNALNTLDVTPEQGEQVMAFLLGMSLAVGHRSCNQPDVMEALARGWQYATIMEGGE